jgi:hypothetical protein
MEFRHTTEMTRRVIHLERALYLGYAWHVAKIFHGRYKGGIP